MKEIFDYYKFQLYERLTSTMTPDEAKDHIITDIFNLNEDELSYNDFKLFFNERFMILELKNKYDYNQILYILSSVFATGYFVSQYFIDSNNITNFLIKDEKEFLKYWKKPKYKNPNKYNKNITSFKLKCEPKWDNSLKIKSDIYHLTNSNNTDTILKYGLLPISGKKKSYHPERIHFSLNEEDSDKILVNLKREDRLRGLNNNYDLLKINISNLKSKDFLNNSYDVVFYKDSNSDGIYTYDRILPENISVIRTNL